MNNNTMCAKKTRAWKELSELMKEKSGENWKKDYEQQGEAGLINSRLVW